MEANATEKFEAHRLQSYDKALAQEWRGQED